MEFTRKLFYDITRHNALYSIMPLENIPSVLVYGILSHDLAARLSHQSVALEDVQKKRDAKVTNSGKGIHYYANLYFDAHNPMLSRLRNKNDELCILAISPEVLNIKDVVVTDRNAATNIVQFLEPSQMTECLNFDIIYMNYWIDENDQLRTASNKAIKCAEVLVPERIPPEYIIGAIVVNTLVKEKLELMNFNRIIKVDPRRFF